MPLCRGCPLWLVGASFRMMQAMAAIPCGGPIPTKGALEMEDQSTSHQADAPVSYTFKPSLVGAVRQFELTDGGVAFEVGSRKGMWPYSAIAAIRLTYRPMSMQPRQFRADIIRETGERLIVLSTSWKSFGMVATQDDAYRAFILALHHRLAGRGSDVACYGGLRPILYALAIGVLVIFAIAMAALMARAVATEAIAGALFLLALAAVFAWQIGGFMRRNKPCRYTADHPPSQLVP